MGSSHITNLRKHNTLVVNNAVIIFKDQPGARIVNLSQMLERARMRGERAPNYVIFHIGSNDMGISSCKEIRDKLNRLFKCFRQALPRACLVWSDILPRRYWTEAVNQVSIEKTRKIINKLIRHDIIATGGKVIRHTNLLNIYENFRKYDVVHLSDCGNTIFSNNFVQALTLFINDSTITQYPQPVIRNDQFPIDTFITHRQ